MAARFPNVGEVQVTSPLFFSSRCDVAGAVPSKAVLLNQPKSRVTPACFFA